MSPSVVACCTLGLLLRPVRGGHQGGGETPPVRALFLAGKPSEAEVSRGLSTVQVRHGGVDRRYVTYVPKHYSPSSPVPLWILAHGSADTPEVLLDMSGVVALAEKHTFAFAALAAIDGAFNVGLDARALNAAGPDDVGYTRAVLREVTRKLNVDMQRIRCAGFSRGARFCSRLASELSSFITGIAVVSGIRFPRPNNATRPLPVIAFHGTEDPVNPYNGMGQAYWLSSVDDAVQRWADFNGCTRHRWERVSTQVLKSLHTGCTDGADVILVQIVKGGHTWPGSWYNFGDLGYVTHEIDASEALREFFVTHPVPERCHTAVRGDPCYEAVAQAREVGVREHPEQYEGLTGESSLEEFQAHLHRRIAADCPLPCPHAKREPSALQPATANASRAVVATALPSTSPAPATTTTTSKWATLRWLGEAEQHAGVIQRYGLSPLVFVASGAAACLAVGAAVAYRASTRARSRQSGRHDRQRPLRLCARDNRHRVARGPPGLQPKVSRGLE